MPTFNTQDHIHLYATTTVFDHTASQFHVLFAGLQENTVVIATQKRALDGTAHLHVLTDDGTGAPVQFKNASLAILATQDEFDALKALQGRRCYYFPLRHMADNVAHVNEQGAPNAPAYRVIVLPLGENGMIDGYLEYWRVNVQLIDDEAKA